ncbi:unnamed protein product [Haemonchus placei]|uniref:Ig-like domain-containing protein n=1 Tax=Haemonchus placei TaxID=6290 RepID=A0A0N4WAB4_HAEPC|nr:unnamed protein product [Haemonchus placei]
MIQSSTQSVLYVSEEDHREYCYFLLSLSISSHPFLLHCAEVPTILTGGAQTVVEGKLASIECAAEGHPPPVISWLRNGIRVESGIQGVRYDTEDKMLIITDVQSSDSGIYVCEATNEAGIARQAYTLEVLGRSRAVKERRAEKSGNVVQHHGHTSYREKVTIVIAESLGGYATTDPPR